MKGKSKPQKNLKTFFHYTEEMGRKEAMKQHVTNENLWMHFDCYVDDCNGYVGESSRDCANRYASRYFA